MSDNEMMPNKGKWAQDIKAEKTSVELPWRAVREAICAASNTGQPAQDMIRSGFNNLEDTTVTGAHMMLDDYIASFGKPSNMNLPGAALYHSCAQAASLAKQALDREIERMQSASARAA